MIQRQLYYQRLNSFLNTDLVKVITGQRRVGKSYMLLQTIDQLIHNGVPKKNIIHIDKEQSVFNQITDDASLVEYFNSKLTESDPATYRYLFIDEVQEIIDFQKAIRSIRTVDNVDIYLTGSNSNIVSSEIATLLSGRYIEIPVYPLTFSEFINFSSFETEEQAFDSYLQLGGMPYLHKLDFDIERCEVYLENVYNTIVLHDVVKRNRIRNVSQIERLITYLSNNTGSITSPHAISKYHKSLGLKMTPNMVLDYIGNLESSYIIHEAKRFDIVGKKIFDRNSKYYFNDVGIRNIKETVDNDINKILENIVHMNLLAFGYEVSVGVVGDKEIDFICKKNNEIEYIQVSYLLANNEVREREFGNLAQISDNYPKYVLTLDPVQSDFKGIKHMHVRDFLINLE